MSQANEIEKNVQHEVSRVQKFFEGAVIFITGGTGFIGSLLLYKLITDCPDIAKIYVLIRHKKEKTSHQRIEEIFQNPIFERLKMKKPDYREKIKPIVGDLEQPGLALHEDDKNLISKEINIIFHLAASVRFNENIKKAVSVNLRATKDMINLAKTIKNLKAFVYCSTAYSFYPRSTISEEFYDTHMSPERLLHITEILNDDELEILTPKIIGDWPNSYTFTKAVAEKFIHEEANNLPIVVFRPSMVISTFKNPVEGWINNLYGPVGLTLGVNVGIIHVVRVNPNLKIDIVPADYVVNNMIVAAQYVGTKLLDQKKNENLDGIPIFNCVSSSDNPITHGEYRKYCYKYFKHWHTIHTVWYNFWFLVPNLYLYTILQFLLHKIPAYIIDFALYVMGKKTKQMIKYYSKFDLLMNSTSCFGTKEWTFKNEYNETLWNTLNNTDKALFEFSMKQMDWDKYFREIFCKGIRIYLLNDPLETLPIALQKYKKFKFAHFVLITFAFFILVYFSKSVFLFIYKLMCENLY